MKIKTLAASAIALAFLSITQANAASVAIDFDTVAAGATATSAAPAGISFHQAIFSNEVDSYGDEIPNTETWKIDTENDALFPVTVENTLLQGYGAAPSGLNALDARWQPVLMHFDTPTSFSSFQFTLDNSFYGNLGNSSAYFLDASKNVLAEILFNETIPGAVVTSMSLMAVQDVVFSSGAFYDNISFNTIEAPVPLPAALPLLLSALGLLGGVVRKAKA